MKNNKENQNKGTSKEQRESKDLSLRVQEAYTRDIGVGVIRIDYESIDLLGASTGDVIEIKGKRRTVAKCLPLYPSDEGKGIMRIDSLIRSNAGIGVGEIVLIRKIKALAAQSVIVSSLHAIPPIDSRYLTNSLESVPLIKGDELMVPYFGGRLGFRVISITPDTAAVMVTQKTVFVITEREKTSKEKEMERLINKINSHIDELEKKLANIVKADVPDESEMSKILKEISTLNETKKYFISKKT